MKTTETNCGACGLFFNQMQADKEGLHLAEFCDSAPVCQLCGEKILDIKAGAIVLPWGETCSNCLDDIKEFGTSRI
jgi:hypothetical protein